MSQAFHHSNMSLLTTRHASFLQKTISKWKARGLKVGFVPTMGALHEGHLSLVKIALEHSDRCVVSIFVNPAQFAPHEDFDSYPRNEAKDLQMLQNAGAHLVYMPDEDAIYPGGMETKVRAGEAARGLETDLRPHFFDGVVNVVSRLFEDVHPDIAVFGEKDYQQLRVICEMVKTLEPGIEIIGAPIVRDKNGLALSSRNAYLSAEELEIANMLNQAIYRAAHDIRESAEENIALEETKALLLEAGFDKIDYVEQRWGRVLAAVWLGKTRLIDNVAI